MEADTTSQLLTVIAVADEALKRRILDFARNPGRYPSDQQGPQVEPFVTLRRIGEILNLDPSTLWRYGVPGHELGGRRRFKLSEITKYLASDEFRLKARALQRERRVKRIHRKAPTKRDVTVISAGRLPDEGQRA